MHIVSYFLVLATFSLSVIANPVAAMGANAQRRANSAAVTADVMSVLNELKGTTDVILPQISTILFLYVRIVRVISVLIMILGSALAESKPNVESVSTLIVQLINALDKTGSNLVLLPSLEKRQDSGNSTSSDDPVADLLAGIISVRISLSTTERFINMAHNRRLELLLPQLPILVASFFQSSRFFFPVWTHHLIKFSLE